MTSSAPAPNPRAVRTRAALLAAGLELLSERPMEAIAIDELVTRAGVAKGSFFNHFEDKGGFAHALGTEVRAGLEQQIDAANAGVDDPVARLASGMRVAVQFALEDRKRAIVMLRGMEPVTGQHHAMNRGIRSDVERLITAGLARPEAGGSGVRYWLGLCQIAMTNIIERQPDRADAAARLRDMLVLGLVGLGVPEDRARSAAGNEATRLLQP